MSADRETYEDGLIEKTRAAQAMRDLLATDGWERLAAILSANIERHKNEMAKGIEVERDYWMLVGRIAAYKDALTLPQQIVNKGIEAEATLLKGDES